MKSRGRIRPVEEYISPDLCREILCRLPVKDLLRFRLVCKVWRSIIDDPQFVSLHLTRYKNNVEGSHLLVLETRSSGPQYPIIRRSDTFRKTGVSDRSLFGPYEFIHIAGSINGLFLLWNKYKDTMTVWNPSIRRHFAMPPFPGSSAGGIRIGFGFDPSTNDYKVVLLFQRPFFQQASNSASVTTMIYLYTFESGCWRVIDSDHRFPLLWTKNAFIKGIIYWVTRYDLFLFDVGKETFSRCSVPDYGSTHNISRETIPVSFRGSLALLANGRDNETEHYCLWVRDQYANWIRLHTVHVDQCSFMCLKTNGEMMFKTKKGVCSYNMNTHEMKVLAKSYHGCRPEAFEYVESLVWPMGV